MKGSKITIIIILLFFVTLCLFSQEPEKCKFVLDSYFDVLKTENRDILLEKLPKVESLYYYQDEHSEHFYEKTWTDYYDRIFGIQLIDNAFDITNFYSDKNKKGILIGDYSGYCFVIDSMKINKNEFIFTAHSNVEIDSSRIVIDFPKIKKDQNYELKIIIDGDYLELFINNMFVAKFCKINNSTLLEYEELIKNNSCDLSKVTWPRHADGTSEYDNKIITPEKIIEYMRNNGRVWSQNEEDNGLVYITYESLDDNFFFVIGNTSFRKSNRYLGFVTDGSKYFYDNYFSIQKTKHKGKYQWQDGLLSFFDYDFDSKKDFLYSYITIPYTVGIEIISPYYDCKSILSIELEEYGVDEYQLDWIEYCILSGKRGIRIRCRGKVHEGDYCYVADGGSDQYAFFYWSPKEQKYILDKTVTQEQIKNAWCPEDYFAYNGLKFSRLDSKLTEEDLRDLDKAQLRLMRNAVYARHGRTFKSVDLQSLWECYTWYKKNPNYSDSLLTDIDKYNIELIQKYESK